MTYQILLGAFCLLLLLGALQDVRSLKISNWICVTLFVVGIVSIAAQMHPSPWWEHVLAFALTLAGGTLLFSMGWMGGGDVKLLAAAALWFDLEGLAFFLLAVAVIGGLVALIVVAVRMTVSGGGIAKRGLAGAKRSISIPYGVPIAIAAIWMSLSAAYQAGLVASSSPPSSAIRINLGE